MAFFVLRPISNGWNIWRAQRLYHNPKAERQKWKFLIGSAANREKMKEKKETRPLTKEIDIPVSRNK
jgi:hypothetical protein